jgi:ATP-dependent protease Clp ATPase subunit
VHPAEEQPRCSFCHLRLDEVDLLAAGQSVYICDSCIDIAAAMLADHRRRKAPAAGGACKARRTAGRKPGRKP